MGALASGCGRRYLDGVRCIRRTGCTARSFNFTCPDASSTGNGCCRHSFRCAECANLPILAILLVASDAGGGDRDSWVGADDWSESARGLSKAGLRFSAHAEGALDGRAEATSIAAWSSRGCRRNCRAWVVLLVASGAPTPAASLVAYATILLASARMNQLAAVQS